MYILLISIPYFLYIYTYFRIAIFFNVFVDIGNQFGFEHFTSYIQFFFFLLYFSFFPFSTSFYFSQLFIIIDNQKLYTERILSPIHINQNYILSLLFRRVFFLSFFIFIFQQQQVQFIKKQEQGDFLFQFDNSTFHTHIPFPYIITTIISFL